MPWLGLRFTLAAAPPGLELPLVIYVPSSCFSSYAQEHAEASFCHLPNLAEPIAEPWRNSGENSVVLLSTLQRRRRNWGEIASEYLIDQVHVNCAMCDIGNGKNKEKSDVNGDVKGRLVVATIWLPDAAGGISYIPQQPPVLKMLWGAQCILCEEQPS